MVDESESLVGRQDGLVALKQLIEIDKGRAHKRKVNVQACEVVLAGLVNRGVIGQIFPALCM